MNVAAHLFFISVLAISSFPAPEAVASIHELVIAQAGMSMAEGEVRKVDRDARKITIKHKEIKNLDMPAMTMVFEVRDSAILDKVKPGDKVLFNVEQVDGALVVTKVEPAK